jgi:phosphoglycerate dehydrogenase-like enzyme
MTDPIRVLVAFPPNPPAELVARLSAVSPAIEVVCCPYGESQERRIARGRADAKAVAENPAPALNDAQRAAFAAADVLMAFDLPVDVLSLAPDLRWIQAIGAGIDHYRGAVLDDRVVVTNASGVAAGPMAEFIVGRLLAVWKGFDLLSELQAKHEWRPAFGRVFAGATVGLVGLGAIGTAVADRTHAFGVHNIGIRRNAAAGGPASVAEVYGPERLHDVLARCDAVVLSAPSTAETENMFDAAAFAAMKPGAVFCNVARGALVDEDALIDALQRGYLGAAILDVVRLEPLPADSPLWDAPNLYLSPHSSASLDRYLEQLFDIFAGNLARFERGEALHNVVDPNA